MFYACSRRALYSIDTVDKDDHLFMLCSCSSTTVTETTREVGVGRASKQLAIHVCCISIEQFAVSVQALSQIYNRKVVLLALIW